MDSTQLDDMNLSVASADTPLVAPAQTIDRQGYRIGQLQLLSKFNEASELLVMPTIYRLPGAAREILGVTNLHGNVIPVFRLHERLGQALTRALMPNQAKTQQQMLLVLGHRDHRAGVVIDGLPTRQKFLATDAATLDDIPTQLQGYAHAAWRQADGLWIELDHASLLNELTTNLHH